MKSTALALALAAAPLAARAGETACRLEAGVITAPASVMGVAGDYVIDTGAPRTLLAETQAQTAGFVGAALNGPVVLAGVRTVQPVEVQDLDARFWWLPTPVAGVIGADLLKAYELDLRFAPCRLTLRRPGRAPPMRAEQILPLAWQAGRLTAPAAVSDGQRVVTGAFVLSTGSDTLVRLSADLAGVPGAAKPQDVLPYGPVRARLRALSFGGELFENPPSGLAPAAEGVAGEIGAPALARFRLRFDFPGGRLLLAKEKGPADRSDGP